VIRTDIVMTWNIISVASNMCRLTGLIAMTESFLLPTENTFSLSMKSIPSTFLQFTKDSRETLLSSSSTTLPLSSSSSLSPSTSTRPLYDGTNYTFPNTKTPAGVAEVLEVSFVHACMQLANGYVDVLKMFIATSVGAYESGFSIDSIQEELELTSSNTANRPLLDEEKNVRRDWFCVVYLTLSAMEHTSIKSSTLPLAINVANDSIPDDIKQRYGKLIERVGENYRNDKYSSLSVEKLMDDSNNDELSQLEKAIILQSLKVATLTPIVVQESLEALGGSNTTPDDMKPPTPPIEGAY